MTIDSVILGDNQFFGVNHMSEDIGMERYEQFKDLTEIKRIIHMAMDYGVRGVMFSTHPSVPQICEMLIKDARIRGEMNFYVNIPYILKYVRMASEMGIAGTVAHTLYGKSLLEKLKFGALSGLNALSANYLGMVNRMIDLELAPFKGLRVKAVFLHNVLCDLIMGLNVPGVLQSFDSYIRKAYGAIPAYGTLNYPRFAQFLNNAGLNESLVMTAVNQKGFYMNPDKASYERAIAENKHTVLAMATLASGRLKPDEAYKYLFTETSVKNLVVGLSSQKHAEETFGAIRRHREDE